MSKSEYIRQRSVLLNGELITMPQHVYHELQSQMFLRIWKERPHRCAVTKQPLGIEPLTYYFHHILAKSNYEQFALCRWNIMLLSWDIHNSYESNADNQPLVKQMKETLLYYIETMRYEFDNDIIYNPQKSYTDHTCAILGRTVTENNQIQW
jgi:hypothetical protein